MAVKDVARCRASSPAKRGIHGQQPASPSLRLRSARAQGGPRAGVARTNTDSFGYSIPMMTRHYYILTPQLAQGRFLTRHLEKLGMRVYGCTLPDEGPLRPSGHLSGTVPWQLLPEDAQMVPTGTDSTAFVLQQRESTRLGDVELRRASLRFSDKRWAIDLAARIGLNVPRTWTDPTAAEYPVFVKSDHEGHHVRQGPVAVRANLPDSLDGLILQEYIQGSATIGVAFLAMEGQLMVAVEHEEVHSHPEPGGSAVLIRRTSDPEAVHATEELLRASGYSGWGLAEFKRRNTSGTLFFMEVNAKFWASSEFTFRSESKFSEILFGTSLEIDRPNSLVFWDRAARRGTGFIIRNSRDLYSARRARYSTVWPSWRRWEST